MYYFIIETEHQKSIQAYHEFWKDYEDKMILACRVSLDNMCTCTCTCITGLLFERSNAKFYMNDTLILIKFTKYRSFKKWL